LGHHEVVLEFVLEVVHEVIFEVIAGSLRTAMG